MGTVRRKQRKRKVNNAGFSLVELLVSMVILAIIVVPLLNSFLTAARTNAKAKRVLEATTAGQNLVERIKAQSVEDFVTGGAASGAAITIPLTDGAGNPLTDADGNPYYCYQKTISLDVDGRTYDAVATMSPEKYLDTGAVSGGSINHYNSAQIPQISNMNEKVSAFFIMDAGDDQRAVTSMNYEAYEDPDRHDAYVASVQRTLTIDIKKDPSNMINVKGTVSYNDNEGNTLSPYYEHDLYTGDKLENVFICFTSLPDLPCGSYSNETITINNEDNVPVKLYLVKQQSAVETSNPDFFRQNYRVTVNVNEGAKSPGEGASCNVVTNMYTGTNATDSVIQLSYKSKFGVLQSGISAWNELKLNQDQSLTQKKSTNMIYDIEVKVYPDGKIADGEELATLTGTKTK